MARAGGQRARDKVAIPLTLRELELWCTWALRLNKGGKLTKVPSGSTLDPEMPQPFDTVAEVVVCGQHGVGVVLTGGVKVGDHWLIALDVDAGRDPVTGALVDWADELLTQFRRSYAEVTPSGAGLRVWLLVRKPPKALPVIWIPADAPEGVDKKPQVQTFGCGPAGYVTVTGDQVPGTCAEPLEVESLDWLTSRYHVKELEDAAVELPRGGGPAPGHGEVLEAVEAHVDGPALVRGEWHELGVPSASEAWWRLVRMVLRSANNHGEVAVQFLLDVTAFGQGLVDSRDPDRYARQEWVSRDVARVAGKAGEVGAGAFDDGEDYSGFEPPRRNGQEKKKKARRVVQWAEFDELVGDQRFLIHGLVPASGVTQIYGEPSCGKTPYALSLALHVALGRDWFGHEVDRQGPVVYMVGEDPVGVRDRLRAEAAQMGLRPADVPLHLTTEPGKLMVPEDAARWIVDVRETCGACVLLVVDTQNTNFGPGNENATEDMTAFMHHLEQISRRLRAHVVLVHHTGHAAKNRGRGSSVQGGAIHAQFEVRRNGRAVVAVPRKNRNWQEPEPLLGTLVPVEIGTDHKGRPITAITLSDSPPSVADVFSEEEGDDVDLRRLLLAVLETEGGPVSQAQLEVTTGLTKKQLRTRVDRAVELGLLEVKVGRGRAKSTYTLTEEGLLCVPSSKGTQGFVCPDEEDLIGG